MAEPTPRERAEQRLEILARQLERVGLADAQVITEPDPPGRGQLRRRAEMALKSAGLADLLDDALRRFRDWVQGAYNRQRSDLEVIQVSWGSTIGPAEDRVSVFRAVDDAVLATIAHELIAEDDRLALLEPYGRLMTIRRERHARSDG